MFNNIFICFDASIVHLAKFIIQTTTSTTYIYIYIYVVLFLVWIIMFNKFEG